MTTSEGGKLQKRVATRRAFIKATRRVLERSAATLAVLAAMVAAGASPTSAQVAPDQAWSTLKTAHFRVTFPRGDVELGRRAAACAERAYGELAKSFVAPPSATIDLLVTDDTDFSNGLTVVSPSDRITVTARPPVDDLDLGFFDDWMQLVITHELTHVFHLDRTGGVGSVLRPIFGRVPTTWPYFPDEALPRWATEGTAVWYESLLTHSGRLKGTYHDMVLRTAVLEGRFESLGQAADDSPVWPGGNRYYVYGSLFFQHLLDEHGSKKMGAFARDVAGQWIPYRLDAASRKVFGTSFSAEWRAWGKELKAKYADLDARLAKQGPVTHAQRLTPGGRLDLYPRVSPDGKRLAYAHADGRSDPQIRVAGLQAENSHELVRTNGTSSFDWLPDGGIVFAQGEYQGPYRTFEDLYRMSPSGHVHRLTHGARLEWPSVGPDGTWAVAVQDGGGTNRLVRVDLRTGAIRPITDRSLDTLWTQPAVSPDGRWIAVSRWTPGAHLDLVVLDAAGSVVSRVTNDRAMDLSATWSPDGRYLLWNSDRTGILNILGASVDTATGRAGPVHLVTNVETGAGYPSVDPSGRWIYFSGYHAVGWDVERIPFSPGSWPLAPAARASFHAPPRPDSIQDAEAPGPVKPYSSLPTFLPTYWEPLYREPVRTPAVRAGNVRIRSREVLGAGLGFQTSSRDLVGRNIMSAYGRVFTKGGKAEGGLSYSYAGLGSPIVTIGVDQSWNEDGARLGQRDSLSAPDTLFALLRDRTVSGSVSFYRTRWRRSASLTFSGGLTAEHGELLNNALKPSTVYRFSQPNRRLGDLSVTLAYSTARTHPFQFGASQGISAFVRAGVRRQLSLTDTLRGVAGYDPAVDNVVGQAAAYTSFRGPGYAAHVLALRFSGGYARGPGANEGYFDVGGASGSPETVVGYTLFGGSPLLFPVRGYQSGDRFGRIAWSASAEYRFPLLLIDRGLGAWPLAVDRVQGTLFADAGNAWGPRLGFAGYENPRRSTLASVGAELTTDVLTFWTNGLLLRGGVAFPLVYRTGAQLYFRVGLSF